MTSREEEGASIGSRSAARPTSRASCALHPTLQGGRCHVSTERNRELQSTCTSVAASEFGWTSPALCAPARCGRGPFAVRASPPRSALSPPQCRACGPLSNCISIRVIKQTNTWRSWTVVPCTISYNLTHAKLYVATASTSIASTGPRCTAIDIRPARS